MPVIAALAAWLMWAPGAAAPVELRWDAPQGCPTEAEVRAGVEALLGEPLTPRLLAASAAILGGVALVVLLERKAPMTTAETESS